MVAFNPDVGGVPAPNMPDQTGASRGSIPNRSFEAIFEGVGAGVKGVVDGYNNWNHYQIDSAVHAGYDDANKLYSDTLPKDLANSSDVLASLQTAYDQGKISDVYYTGTLAKLQKNLRSQYPQYEDYIDNTLKSITGINPANAYRESIMQQFAQDQNSRQDSEKFWQQYVKENEKYFPADYMTNPDKYDRAKVREYVANQKQLDYSLESDNLRIDNLSKNNKLTDEMATESAVTALNQTVQTRMSNLSMTMGLGDGDLMKKIADMNTNGYTEEESTQLISGLGQLKATMSLELDKQLNTPLNPDDPLSKSYAAILGDPDLVKKLKDQAMAPILAIEEFALNKDWGMVAYYTRLNSLQQSKDVSTILNTHPELRAANALATIDKSLATVFLTNSGKQEGIFSEISAEISASTLAGTDTFNAGVSRMAEARTDAATKAGGINSMIDNNTAAILSPTTTPEQLKNIVNGTYGIDNKGKDIFAYVKAGEKEDLYKTMFSPEITQSIIASGDKDLIKTYYESALDKFKSIPTLTQAASVVSNIQNWSKASTVQFIPSGGGPPMLIVSTDPSKIDSAPGGKAGGGAVEGMRKNDMKYISDAVDTINNTFNTLNPMLTAMGYTDEQKTEVFKKIVGNLNIEMEHGKQGGFFDGLLSGFANIMEGSVADQMQAKENSKGAPMTETFTTDTPNNVDISNVGSDYYSAIKAQESGGSATIKNPNSSATGLYQFMSGTWNDLRRKYPNAGLTADGRTDAAQQEIAIRLFTQDNADMLQASGVPVTNGNLYAAHFLGVSDAAQVLSADDSDLVSDYVPPRVIRSNPFLDGMTVAEFRKWTARVAK